MSEETLSLGRELRRRIHSALEQCRRKGICFCKHCERGILPFYEDARIQLLENCCKDRNKDSQLTESSSLSSRLPGLDSPNSQQCFRRMHLPIQLRLRIYEMVFEPGKYQELSPRHASDVVEPALLFTNRQICKEATPIFYNYLEGEDRVWLTHIDKLKKLGHLRHVCFRLWDNVDMHDVHIDLDSCSVDNWLISSVDMPFKCPCQTPKQWTVLQWREHTANTTHQMLFPFRMLRILESVDLCIQLVDKTVRRFRTLCVAKSGKLVTRIPGLAYLAQAAWFVLDARSQWVDAMGYEGESDLDLDEDEVVNLRHDEESEIIC